MKKLFEDMKRIMLFLLALVSTGCIADWWSDGSGSSSSDEDDSGTMIVLGEQLDNPYSVTNITKALESLYPTKADRIDVTATDIYVRFLPEDEAQMAYLQDTLDLDLVDYPLDYEIVTDGDYYHDPDIDEDSITWQYAVVSQDFEFPQDISYEILDDCYIPDDDSTRSDDDDIDWDAVEREAYSITGNGDMLDEETKGTKYYPAGRLTIIDEDYCEGKPIGVSGVRMRCNTFVKVARDYTDQDGYYEMSKKFSAKPRYRIVYKNKKGFAIGFNKILVPASTSSLGKASPEGLDYEVTPEKGRKIFTRCTVNNAGWDYYTRCSDEDDLNIDTPPSKLRLWLFQNASTSAAMMLKHGAILDLDLLSSVLGDWAWILTVVKAFCPDITLGLEDYDSYGEIYSLAWHELAHASHFSQVGKDYWNKFIYYIVITYFSSDGDSYGDGSGSYAGYCEVGEMWAYFMQNWIYNDRYGGAWQNKGSSNWFHPQIFRYLNERGVTVTQIFKALTSDVTCRDELQDELKAICSDDEAICNYIDQIFEQYSE